jgi:N,N'-diacetyllegionaminate synthase
MIICEVGLNHCGDINYANQYVSEIIRCKSDAILFHIREKSFYLSKENEMKILPDEFYINAIKNIKSNNIEFGVTISDLDKIDFCEKIGVDFYKVLSQEIENTELIKKLMKTNKRVFVSTGLSDLDGIQKLVNLIKEHKDKFSLIHTTLDPNLDYVNLKAIPMLRNKFNISVGFGSHARNARVLFLSLAYEPSDVFFYVKGNRVEKHQDEIHAINLDKLSETIQDLRELPLTIGTELKLKINLGSAF